MPKCFPAGIEIPMENAYLLDCGVAKRAPRDLKLRPAAVERSPAHAARWRVLWSVWANGSPSSSILSRVDSS